MDLTSLKIGFPSNEMNVKGIAVEEEINGIGFPIASFNSWL